jgi:hypothetical protein
MRLAIVIVTLAAIAVVMIQFRRAEVIAQCEIQQLRIEQVSLNRSMWDQQARLSYIKAPQEVRRRSDEMALDLVTPGPSQKHLASGLGQRK